MNIREKKLEIAKHLKAKHGEKEALNLASQIIEIDPTSRSGKHEYVDQIMKWVETGKVILPEDYETARSSTRSFFKMKKYLPILRGKSIEDFNSPGDIRKLINSGKKKTKKRNRIESFDYLGSKDEYSLYKVEEEHKEAFCKLIQDTEWCVKDPKFFDEYGAPFYYLSKENSSHGLLHLRSSEFRDVYDDSFSTQEAVPLKDWLRECLGSDFIARECSYLYYLMQPKEILETKALCNIAAYAKEVIRGRWAEAEGLILGKAELACHDSKNKKSAFNNCKSILCEAASAAYYYAKEVIKGRWLEAEEIIGKNPSAAYLYAKEIIKGRWPEAEETISTVAGCAFVYAKEVVKGRWPAGEKTISTVAGCAFVYAKEVVKGRWPAGEKAISENTWISHDYQQFVYERKKYGTKPEDKGNAFRKIPEKYRISTYFICNKGSSA